MAHVKKNWLNFLSPDDIHQIDQASRRVLIEVGVRLEDEDLKAKLLDQGCGNHNQRVQFTPEIIDQTIAGLGAVNDGPTPLADITTLAATVVAGSNVVYAWDPGDGSGPLAGQAVTYTYPTAGTYTAIVTAVNSVSTDVATTTVIVDEAITGLSATDDGPTVLSNATAFTATAISAESRPGPPSYSAMYPWASGETFHRPAYDGQSSRWSSSVKPSCARLLDSSLFQSV